MSSSLVFLCLFFVSALVAVQALPQGTAAWVYDTNPNTNISMWASSIAGFNAKTSYPINIIFSYGGDVWYDGSNPQPFQTNYYVTNQQAAYNYSQVVGVDTVILVVDGAMNGGDPESPDVSKYTATQVQTWADNTASVYCSHAEVSGIQVDLEPFTGKYIPNTLVYLARLSANLASTTYGCVNAQYPQGRTISFFLGPNRATAEVYQALGSNGFTVISGYDLGSEGGVPITPKDYRTELDASISTVIENAKSSNGSYMLGIPASASTTEFTLFKGTVQGYPMYSATQDSYIVEAYGAINSSGLRLNPYFLGESLWGFMPKLGNPPNSFTPTNAFATAGEEDYLANRFGGSVTSSSTTSSTTSSTSGTTSTSSSTSTSSTPSTPSSTSSTPSSTSGTTSTSSTSSTRTTSSTSSTTSPTSTATTVSTCLILVVFMAFLLL